MILSKYQGTGNDFVIVDNRDNTYNLSKKEISTICDRRFGIGADGFMFLEKHDTYDFVMRYFNADGGEASMCGNGGRCIVAFAKQIGIITKKTTFLAVDGIHEATIENNNVSIKMQDVNSIELFDNNYFMNTGSPHFVKFIDSPIDFNTYEQGKKIRYSDLFAKEGVNVNFVSYIDNGINVLTYERGVEDETFSCGTGVVASCIASYINDKSKGTDIMVETKGGKLNVSFDYISNNLVENIWLTGPAQEVFEGEIKI